MLLLSYVQIVVYCAFLSAFLSAFRTSKATTAFK